jgi:demethylmenaquinone methyltransferase/2-methoxy-6-polyprenyl-1,4-benzoquinol methylase
VKNRARYNALARAYPVAIRLGSLGLIPRLQRALAEEVDVIPGGTLVELGCGPATVTPHLLQRVGPEGTVIGVDIADKMIARARQQAERADWRNARFERSDALDYTPPRSVDAVVFCLSLSALGDCERGLERALAMLEVGGQLVILDSIPERSRPLANLLMHLKAPLVGARPSAAPLEFARRKLEGVRVRSFLFGVYTLLSGRKPAA